MQSHMAVSPFAAAVHALELDEHGWIEALFAEGRELFDAGEGLFVYSYRAGVQPALQLAALAGEHTAPSTWAALEGWGSANASVLARSYVSCAGGLELRSAALRGPLRDLRARFEHAGVVDLLTIQAHDARGFGVFLSAPRHRPVVLDERNRRALDRVVVELGAALRLREARRVQDLRRLTVSEREVITLIAHGASDKEIARALGIGLSTVSTFAHRARTKLGCHPGGEALVALTPAARARRSELFARLTPAECDVAADLVLGKSYAEIALRRGSAVRTVAAQCASIFRKCAVTGQRALAAALVASS